MSTPTEVDVKDLATGTTYYFKSKIYNGILYKGRLQSINETSGGYKWLVFKEVELLNLNVKPLHFESYINPLSKINKDEMIHDLNKITQDIEYIYFTSLNDKIKEDVTKRSLEEILDKHFKESTEPQHSEVGSLISSFCGINTPKRGGKKSRRRNRKSRRKTKSRK